MLDPYNKNLSPDKIEPSALLYDMNNTRLLVESAVRNNTLNSIMKFVHSVSMSGAADVNAPMLEGQVVQAPESPYNLAGLMSKVVSPLATGLCWYEIQQMPPEMMEADDEYNLEFTNEFGKKPLGDFSLNSFLQHGRTYRKTKTINTERSDQRPNSARSNTFYNSMMYQNHLKDFIIKGVIQGFVHGFYHDLYYKDYRNGAAAETSIPYPKTYLDHSLTPTPLDFTAAFGKTQMATLNELLNIEGEDNTIGNEWIVMVPTSIKYKYLSDPSVITQTGGSVRGDTIDSRVYSDLVGGLYQDPIYDKIFFFDLPEKYFKQYKQTDGSYICPVFNAESISYNLYANISGTSMSDPLNSEMGQKANTWGKVILVAGAIPVAEDGYRSLSDEQHGYSVTYKLGTALLKANKENYAFIKVK